MTGRVGVSRTAAPKRQGHAARRAPVRASTPVEAQLGALQRRANGGAVLGQLARTQAQLGAAPKAHALAGLQRKLDAMPKDTAQRAEAACLTCLPAGVVQDVAQRMAGAPALAAPVIQRIRTRTRRRRSR